MNRRVVALSLLLFLFTVPHTLEDFAVGEPQQARAPAALIALVAAALFALQALGLYWLGQEQRRGLVVQAVVGFFWPLAAGAAQLPDILSGEPYRAGFLSIAYVVGIIVVGLALLLFSLLGLWRGRPGPR